MRRRLDIPDEFLTQKIKGSRYYMRTLTIDDRDVRALLRLEEANADNPFFGVDPKFKDKSFLGKYESVLQEIESHQRGWGRDFVFGLFQQTKYQNRLVGGIYVQSVWYPYAGVDAAGQPVSGQVEGMELGICLSRRADDALLFSRQGVAVAATETLVQAVAAERGEKTNLFARIKTENQASFKYCDKCGFGQKVILTSLNGEPCADVVLLRTTARAALQHMQQRRTPCLNQLKELQAGYAR